MNKIILISLLSLCFQEPTKRTRTTDLSCKVHNPNKKDCGWYGINQEKCEELECCWKPDVDAKIPWCFNGEDDSDTIRTIDDLSCTVLRENRKECGYYGINKKECESRGCCWKSDEDDSTIPWCFYGEDDSDTLRTTDNLSCKVLRSDRKECGYYGIDKKECESRGCCWKSDEENSLVPWCFYGIDDEESTSSSSESSFGMLE